MALPSAMLNPNVAGVIRSSRLTDPISCSTDCPSSTSATSLTVQRIWAPLVADFAAAEDAADQLPPNTLIPTTLHGLLGTDVAKDTMGRGRRPAPPAR